MKNWEEDWKRGNTLGEGGQGTTFKATSRKFPELIGALKILKRKNDPERLSRLKEEVRSLHKLRHSQVAELLDENCSEGSTDAPYIVTKFIEGDSLDKWVKANGLPDQPFVWFESLLNTLHYCHQQLILHRDIKPGNIMINVNSPLPVLIDFGLSYNLAEPLNDELTQDGQVLGNSFVILPEYHSSSTHKQDHRSDLCALSGVLFYLLTGEYPGLLTSLGRAPHQREPGQNLIKEKFTEDTYFHKRLIGFFDKAFQDSPEDRFQNHPEVISAIHFLHYPEGIPGLSYNSSILDSMQLPTQGGFEIELVCGGTSKSSQGWMRDINVFVKNNLEQTINNYGVEVVLPSEVLSKGSNVVKDSDSSLSRVVIKSNKELRQLSKTRIGAVHCRLEYGFLDKRQLEAKDWKVKGELHLRGELNTVIERTFEELRLLYF